MEEILIRLTLENELQTNKNIEEEITKWQNYRAKGEFDKMGVLNSDNQA